MTFTWEKIHQVLDVTAGSGDVVVNSLFYDLLCSDWVIWLTFPKHSVENIISVVTLPNIFNHLNHLEMLCHQEFLAENFIS